MNDDDIRDQFAADAMVALVIQTDGDPSFDHISRASYRLAAAMMAAREADRADRQRLFLAGIDQATNQGDQGRPI